MSPPTTVPATQPGTAAPASSGASRARRTRLARGPLTIGEPAAAVTPVLCATEPYRPDTIADGGTAVGLTVRAASVRGLYKRYLGGARQDDLCLRCHEPTRTLIAAIADGVSAAPNSDLGAALAVRHAVAAVARQLDAGAQTLDWAAVFEQAAWALVEERRRCERHADAHDAAAALATTLTVAAVTLDDERAELTAQLAAVGDSPALALERGRFRALLDCPQGSDGLLADTVAALPLDLLSLRQRSCVLGREVALILCTDGLALPLADGRGDVGRAFARELARVPDVVDFARLLDFSRATYDDDRTLVVIWAGDGVQARDADPTATPAADAPRPATADADAARPATDSGAQA
jgi:hypothetical protein